MIHRNRKVDKKEAQDNYFSLYNCLIKAYDYCLRKQTQFKVHCT